MGLLHPYACAVGAEANVAPINPSVNAEAISTFLIFDLMGNTSLILNFLHSYYVTGLTINIQAIKLKETILFIVRY